MPYRDPDAQREYQRKRAATQRAEFFAGKSCAHCGSTDRLELDHVDPTMKVSHNVWSWSEERRQGEIAKCQVLCSPCHKAKTKADFFRSTCKYGHPLDGEREQGKWRRCLTCHRDSMRERRAKVADN